MGGKQKNIYVTALMQIINGYCYVKITLTKFHIVYFFKHTIQNNNVLWFSLK